MLVKKKMEDWTHLRARMRSTEQGWGSSLPEGRSERWMCVTWMERNGQGSLNSDGMNES